jgi:hypothetical protein
MNIAKTPHSIVNLHFDDTDFKKPAFIVKTIYRYNQIGPSEETVKLT